MKARHLLFIACLLPLLANCTTPSGSSNDDNLDTDRDGLTDRQERELGTDPNDADTDGDGSTDGAEVESGSDPLDAEDRDDDRCDRGGDRCGPDLNCASDADCAAGQGCLRGECVDGGVCIDQDGDGFCGADDCDDLDPSVNPYAPETIDRRDNDCDGDVDEQDGGACGVNEDCAAGQVCWDGRCVADAPSCRTDDACAAAQVCVSGRCLAEDTCDDANGDGRCDELACAVDADCAAAESCWDGLCVASADRCLNDQDCATGQACIRNTCQPINDCIDADGDGFCALDDCDDDNAMINPAQPDIQDGLDNDCDGNVDEQGAACNADGDCAAGEYCWDGLCVADAQSCRSDVDCAAGQQCVAGACMP